MPCRNLLGGRGGLELLILRSWLELGRRVGRLFGLFGRHLPGRGGRLDLPELRSWFVLGVGLKRVLELLGGHLPGIDGCFELQLLCRGNGIELDWGVGVDHMRALLGGLLLVDFGGRCVRGMHRRECRCRCRCVELCAVRRRPIRGFDGFVGVHFLPGRPVPDGRRRNGLCELLCGSVWDHTRCKHKCLPELRGRPVPDGRRRNGLCELPCGSVRDHTWCKHQCLLQLWGWPVPNGHGSVELQ